MPSMPTHDDPNPEPPPGIRTEGDKYLYSELQRIAKAVDPLRDDLTARIEALSAQLATVVQAIASLPELSEDVRNIRDEFSGFRDFRDRFEGYEKAIKKRTTT